MSDVIVSLEPLGALRVHGTVRSLLTCIANSLGTKCPMNLAKLVLPPY